MNNLFAEENLILSKCILDELGFRFWITDGTLLGAYRDGDFINHDNDIDIGMFIDEINIEELIKNFNHHQFVLTRKLGMEEFGYELTFNRKGINLDIFFFYKEKNLYWHCAWNNGKPICYKYEKFELKNFKFKNEHYLAPENIEKYILQKYGSNWRIPDKEWNWATSPKNIFKPKVMTVGCFDTFHYGHKKLIEKMRFFSDEIYIGIHDDNSIKELKGKYPIDNLETRVKNLEEENIFIIDSKDPTKFIENCFNENEKDSFFIYVRGSDMPDFPGKSFVDSHMRLIYHQYTNGVSSSKIKKEIIGKEICFYLNNRNEFKTLRRCIHFIKKFYPKNTIYIYDDHSDEKEEFENTKRFFKNYYKNIIFMDTDNERIYWQSPNLIFQELNNFNKILKTNKYSYICKIDPDSLIMSNEHDKVLSDGGYSCIVGNKQWISPYHSMIKLANIKPNFFFHKGMKSMYGGCYFIRDDGWIEDAINLFEYVDLKIGANGRWEEDQGIGLLCNVYGSNIGSSERLKQVIYSNTIKNSEILDISYCIHPIKNEEDFIQIMNRSNKTKYCEEIKNLEKIFEQFCSKENFNVNKKILMIHQTKKKQNE